MAYHEIESITILLEEYLKSKYQQKKFAIKFNGEFLLACAKSETLAVKELLDLPYFTSSYKFNENKIMFYISLDWLRMTTENIQGGDYRKGELLLYSQIKRLEKQIEFGLTSGDWTYDVYELCLNIIYFLHTNSAKIRTNVVKKCARLYNILQRNSVLPTSLVRGYMNALSAVSEGRNAK